MLVRFAYPAVGHAFARSAAGYVCSAGSADELEPALARWFGEPR